MDEKLIFTALGYYHKTMMKTAYMWLPLFAIVILFCSYFDRFRFILYLSAGAGTYYFIMSQLKKKSVKVYFSAGTIKIDNIKIPRLTIENYYISLPLNKLIILRIQTDGKQEAVYIEKEQKDNVIHFFKKENVPERRISYDNYLQYGHLILPFLGLLVSAIAYDLFLFIKYY